MKEAISRQPFSLLQTQTAVVLWMKTFLLLWSTLTKEQNLHLFDLLVDKSASILYTGNPLLLIFLKDALCSDFR